VPADVVGNDGQHRFTAIGPQHVPPREIDLPAVVEATAVRKPLASIPREGNEIAALSALQIDDPQPLAAFEVQPCTTRGRNELLHGILLPSLCTLRVRVRSSFAELYQSRGDARELRVLVTSKYMRWITSLRSPRGVAQRGQMFLAFADPYASRMAQRLVIPSREEVDGELSVARPWWQFSVRFNVAISQSIPVARKHERETEGVMMRWGLALKSPQDTISFTSCGSVRSDALKSAQDLRRMWVNGRRGIVPLAGFYLWQRAPGGYHQPYYLRLVNRPVFGVAALWERAEAGDEVIESCALITVDANPLVAEIDPTTRQMPAILQSGDYGAWLSSSVDQANELLRPYSQTQMVCHPVAPYVNYLEFDEPSLIRPVDR